MNQGNVRRWIWLVVATALSLLCGLVRRWQLSTAFEGELSLAIPFAPASVVLAVLLVVTVAVMGVLAFTQPVARLRGTGRSRRLDNAMFAQGDVLFLVCAAFAAGTMLMAVPKLFSHGRELWTAYQTALANNTWRGGDNGMLTMVTAGLGVLGAIGLIQVGREGYQGGRRAKGGFWAALPAVLGCGWLMATYRAYASHPVLWEYVPLLLAIIAGMLLYIDWAGLSCKGASPRRTLFWAGMTYVLSMLCLSSQYHVGHVMLLGSQIFAALGVMLRLPINLATPPADDLPATHTEERETHEEEDSHV